MKVAIAIPARIGSTRLFEKMLIPLDGTPLVQRVYESCSSYGLPVTVLTDDLRISELVKHCITSKEKYENGTARIAGHLDHFREYDYIINVQGDLPFIPHHILKTMLEHAEYDEILTLHCTGGVGSVSVVFDKDYDGKQGYAVDFIRDPIPGLKHIGIYGYPIKALEEYKDYPISMYESNRSLEQLRWFDTRFRIKSVGVEDDLKEINTRDDVNEYDDDDEKVFVAGYN